MTTPTYYRDRTTPNRFYYIPGDPAPELAPNGAPTLALWVTDTDARLQLGVQWHVSAAAQESLRRTIALHHPPLTAAALHLQPAPMQVQGVDLLLGDGQAPMQTLATAKSSGFPPYIAIFGVALDATQKQQAIAALHGRTGFLAVRYRITVQNAEGHWAAGERITDIGDWFAERVGSDHIQIMPTPSLQPSKPASPAGLQIAVGEDLHSAPLAYIQLVQGGETAVLRPAAFAPVKLTPTAAGVPVRCTAYYTTGQPYSTNLTPVAGATMYQLTPADLGLALVTVSAPTHQAAKAHEVRVLVRYLPTGAGSDDERTVYLRGDHWQEQWWVITRHPTLQGELEITAKVTQANGAVLAPLRHRQQSGAIVIA